MGAVRCGALLLSALLLTPVTALAQTPLEFDARVGPAIPIGNFSDEANTGAFLSGTVFANSGPPVSLGLEVGGNLGHSKGSTDTTIFQLTPLARVEAPLAHKHGKAYLLLGAGYYHTHYDQGSGGSQSHNDFGVNVGVGFLVNIASHIMLGFDLRYHLLFESGTDPEYLVPGLLLSFAR
jgi:hypothetical protein